MSMASPCSPSPTPSSVSTASLAASLADSSSGVHAVASDGAGTQALWRRDFPLRREAHTHKALASKWGLCPYSTILSCFPETEVRD
jgi:hypothetical protein